MRILRCKSYMFCIWTNWKWKDLYYAWKYEWL